MKSKKRIRLTFDPRTTLLLLLLANIIALIGVSIEIETTVIITLVVLLSLSGYTSLGLKWLGLYALFVCIQLYLIPLMSPFFTVMFSVLVVYARKLLPCVIIGSLIIKTIPIRLLLLSLRKWHVPQKITIPLAISIRYFPAIREEMSYIRDAMKLRGMKGIIKKIESTYVPVLISAMNTADELSAAAITRGIENPSPKTCAVDITFGKQDYISLAVGCLFVLIACLEK
ncbi:cobalt transporter [Bacillaceae bacterium SAS-127]|nr:cobalt transporter [Bacillaceae bacterium SAS-127]